MVLTGPSRLADTAGTSTKYVVRSRRGDIMTLFRARGQPFLARADHPKWPPHACGSSSSLRGAPTVPRVSRSSCIRDLCELRGEEGHRGSWTCARGELGNAEL